MNAKLLPAAAGAVLFLLLPSTGLRSGSRADQPAVQPTGENPEVARVPEDWQRWLLLDVQHAAARTRELGERLAQAERQLRYWQSVVARQEKSVPPSPETLARAKEEIEKRKPEVETLRKDFESYKERLRACDRVLTLRQCLAELEAEEDALHRERPPAQPDPRRTPAEIERLKEAIRAELQKESQRRDKTKSQK
jgi:chromosome segregation ATPase